MKARLVVVLSVFFCLQASYGAQKIEASGEVEAVTLFRGQALVTRVVPVEVPSGAVQLSVPDLPESVVGESLFVNADSGIQVRAVRYHTRAVERAPEKEVQDLDDQIEIIEKQLREKEAMEQLVQEKMAYLEKLNAYVPATAQTEMTKGVLNAETLSTVTQMVFEKRAELAGEFLENDEESRELTQQVEFLKRKRAELAKSQAKTIHEALIFLDKDAETEGKLRLSYLVRNATWSPTYNIHGDLDSREVEIEVGALVHQTSGEDWESVDITLSTAGARLVAEGPTLAPLWLHLRPGTPQAVPAINFQKRVQSVASNIVNQKIAQQKATAQTEQRGIQWDMNKWVQEWQQIELCNDPEELRDIEPRHTRRESGLAVTYGIEGQVSIASRYDNQMVRIAELNMPSTFFYEATPLLTREVYRYAEMVNDSTLSLLQGTASVYLDDEFVGTATLPMVAPGQNVTVGFGTDPQLRAWREFVSRDAKDQILGSKKEVKYEYRLVLENYSDSPSEVRVFDRIPSETDTISVELDQLEDPLSEDAHYQRVYYPKGILRWDVEVPPAAARETARIINYSFELKYDAKFTIAPAPQAEPSAKQRAQFEEMMEQRMYKR